MGKCRTDAHDELARKCVLRKRGEFCGFEEKLVGDGDGASVLESVERGVYLAAPCIDAGGDEVSGGHGVAGECLKGRDGIEGTVEGEGKGFEHRHGDAQSRKRAGSTGDDEPVDVVNAQFGVSECGVDECQQSGAFGMDRRCLGFKENALLAHEGDRLHRRRRVNRQNEGIC